MLPWDRDYVYAEPAAVERYVKAAILSARDGYDDRKWHRWADAWLDGRDRSYKSAQSAYRNARESWARALAEAAKRTAPESWLIETFCDELPAERAVRAAGLALLAAPIGPNLVAALARLITAVKHSAACLRGRRELRDRIPVGAGWDAPLSYLCAVFAPPPPSRLANPALV